MDILEKYGTIIPIVLAIIIVIAFIGIINKKKTEGYSQMPNSQDYSIRSVWDITWQGPLNKDCYSLKGNDCLKYSNCGLCMKDGKFQCVPGDVEGPLFKEKCYRWMYRNYRDRAMFNEVGTTISPPGDYFYPRFYETRWPSPVGTASLMY